MSYTRAVTTATDALEALIPSWQIHLRAERKTEGTIQTYLDGVRPTSPGAATCTPTPWREPPYRSGPASSQCRPFTPPPPRYG